MITPIPIPVVTKQPPEELTDKPDLRPTEETPEFTDTPTEETPEELTVKAGDSPTQVPTEESVDDASDTDSEQDPDSDGTLVHLSDDEEEEEDYTNFMPKGEFNIPDSDSSLDEWVPTNHRLVHV